MNDYPDGLIYTAVQALGAWVRSLFQRDDEPEGKLKVSTERALDRFMQVWTVIVKDYSFEDRMTMHWVVWSDLIYSELIKHESYRGSTLHPYDMTIFGRFVTVDESLPERTCELRQGDETIATFTVPEASLPNPSVRVGQK